MKTTLKDTFIKLLNSEGFNRRSHKDNIREYVYFNKDRYIRIEFADDDDICNVNINIELEHSSINLRMFTNDITKLEALILTSLYVD